MRTHDAAPFLYWESVPGGREGIALLGDLDPVPSFLPTPLLDVNNHHCLKALCRI